MFLNPKPILGHIWLILFEIKSWWIPQNVWSKVKVVLTYNLKKFVKQRQSGNCKRIQWYNSILQIYVSMQIKVNH